MLSFNFSFAGTFFLPCTLFFRRIGPELGIEIYTKKIFFISELIGVSFTFSPLFFVLLSCAGVGTYCKGFIYFHFFEVALVSVLLYFKFSIYMNCAGTVLTLPPPLVL